MHVGKFDSFTKYLSMNEEQDGDLDNPERYSCWILVVSQILEEITNDKQLTAQESNVKFGRVIKVMGISPVNRLLLASN